LRLDWVKRVTIPAAVVALFFLGLRYAQLNGILSFGRFGLLLDKWDFGFGRMIDFTAVAVLAIQFRPILRSFAVRPLVMLGQASLPVFCVHLLCVFFALTIMKNDPMLGGWKAIAIIVASLSALLITAKVANRRRAKAMENRATGPTPPRAGYGPGLAEEKVA
jgi:peptidoglycan/LPS O-acetylase OafA/YrhL